MVPDVHFADPRTLGPVSISNYLLITVNGLHCLYEFRTVGISGSPNRQEFFVLLTGRCVITPSVCGAPVLGTIGCSRQGFRFTTTKSRDPTTRAATLRPSDRQHQPFQCQEPYRGK